MSLLAPSAYLPDRCWLLPELWPSFFLICLLVCDLACLTRLFAPDSGYHLYSAICNLTKACCPTASDLPACCSCSPASTAEPASWCTWTTLLHLLSQNCQGLIPHWALMPPVTSPGILSRRCKRTPTSTHLASSPGTWQQVTSTVKEEITAGFLSNQGQCATLLACIQTTRNWWFHVSGIYLPCQALRTVAICSIPIHGCAIQRPLMHVCGDDNTLWPNHQQDAKGINRKGTILNRRSLTLQTKPQT